MKNPEPFIVTNNEGKLVITKESREILASVKNPVTVVAIVGLYRTGKSFLMNRLVGSQSGFPLGAAVQAKTKGIWMWAVPHPSGPESRHLILLDTEGLADPEKGDRTHDAWIFSLAILLSSCFVYNSMETIDEGAIEKLHFVTELTERIRIKSGGGIETGDGFDAFFPSFFWVVRDFMLELTINDTPCTSDDYLENALKLKNGTSQRVSDHNLPRKALKTFFHERKCFAFVRPVTDEEQLRNLDKVNTSELRPQFLQEADRFCNTVFDTVPSKSIRGNQLDGSRLLSVTESYLEALNNNAIPCIGNAFKTMAELENRKAIDESITIYEAIMNNDLVPWLPVFLGELSDIHQEAEQSAVITFLEAVLSDDDGQYQDEMKECIRQKYQHYVKVNEDTSTKKCQDILERLYNDNIRSKMQVGDYAERDGYKKYQNDRITLLHEYENIREKGIAADIVMSAFNADHEDEAHAILNADVALSDKERQLEKKNAAIRREELATKAERELNQELKQTLIDEQISNMIHIQQLEKKQADAMKLAQREYDKKITRMEKRFSELQKTGLKEQANILQDQIENNRKQNAELMKQMREQQESTTNIIADYDRLIENYKKTPPHKVSQDGFFTGVVRKIENGVGGFFKKIFGF